MRYFFAVPLVIVIAVLRLAAAVEEGESRRLLDQETGLLSARLLAADGGRRWSAAPFPEAEKLLFERMKADPIGAASVAAARKDGGTFLRDALAADYAAELRRLLEPFREELQAETEKMLEKVPSGLLEKKFASVFPAAFSAARKRLVAEQRAELIGKVYPSEAELEETDDAELTRLLTGRLLARRNAPLFEENLAFVRDTVIAPAIASGRDQQKRQLELAERLPVAADLWTASEIVSVLEAELAAETAKWDDDKIYTLFRRTRRAIADRAARLPRERVVAELPRRIAVPDYAALLAGEPERHLTPEPGLTALCEAAGREAVIETFRELAVPEAVAATLAADGAVGTAASAAAAKLVRPALLDIRRKATAAQFEKYCPELEANRWRAEPAVVEAYYAGGGGLPPTLPEFEFRDAPLFVETRTAIADRVRAVLSRAAGEVAEQFRLVAHEYDMVIGEMRKRREENVSGWLGRWFGSSGVSLAEIRELYEAKVLKLYNAGQREYRELFDSVRSEIDVRSRAILQQLEAEPETRTIPEREERPPEHVIRCRIRVEAEPEMLHVRLNGRTFSAPPGEKSERRLIAETVGEWKRFSEAAASGAARFEVELQIGGGPVYYRFVAHLREELKTAVAGSDASVSDELVR